MSTGVFFHYLCDSLYIFMAYEDSEILNYCLIFVFFQFLL